MQKVKVAAIQMVSTYDVEKNLADAEQLIDEAAIQGAQFALLPEYFPIIGRKETKKLRYQEPYQNGPIQTFLAEQAKKHNLWLMGGTIPLASNNPERVLNSCMLFNPEGICTARYDKIHLFDVNVSSEEEEIYNESETMMPGSEIVTAETPFGNIGMSVCYDLRFPELFRKMVDKNINIITVPAAFTEATGRAHWEMLLRARAVENLCFVIAANQGGQNSETRTTWGHSMIIDPWGDILGELDKGPGVLCVEIDLNHVTTLRESFPALKGRIIF